MDTPESELDESSLDKALDVLEKQRKILLQRQLHARLMPGGRAKRSSYSAKIASQFKPFFEQVLKEQQDVCISYSLCTCSIQRFYQKVCDSLVYLVNNAPTPEERQVWASLKTQLKFEISSSADEGIWLRWRTAGATFRGATDEVRNNATGMGDVVQQIMHWIEDPHTPVFAIRNINLSLDKQQVIRQLFETAGITNYKVTINSVTATTDE